MIGSSDNSGGVVVGALVCGIECSCGFKSCLMLILFSFHLLKFLVGRLYITRSIAVTLRLHFVRGFIQRHWHRGLPACCTARQIWLRDPFPLLTGVSDTFPISFGGVAKN